MEWHVAPPSAPSGSTRRKSLSIRLPGQKHTRSTAESEHAWSKQPKTAVSTTNLGNVHSSATL